MIDGSVPISRLVTAGLWSASVGLLAVAWVIGAADDWNIGIMLALTSMPLAAAAAAAQVRGYSLRVCSMLRASAEARGDEGGLSIHSIH